MIRVSIDGVITDASAASVSVLDRGFLFGDSVFEVLRTYGGVPRPERLHLERLARSCERVGIELPVSLPMLSEEIRAVLAVAGEPEAWIRVVVTRGTGPITFDVRTAHDPRRVVIVQPLVTPPDEVYAAGVAVAIATTARALDPSAAAGAKNSNYLKNLLAADEARRHGGYEAVLIGPGGELLEGASSNLFVVRDGVVLTPPLELGILGGITRAVVLDAARALGIETRERVLFPHDLYTAGEAFLTSSIREVVPIVRADGATIGSGLPGPLAPRLRAAYREAVATE